MNCPSSFGIGNASIPPLNVIFVFSVALVSNWLHIAVRATFKELIARFSPRHFLEPDPKAQNHASISLLP
jgi:hypothetical protein